MSNAIPGHYDFNKLPKPSYTSFNRGNNNRTINAQRRVSSSLNFPLTPNGKLQRICNSTEESLKN